MSTRTLEGKVALVTGGSRGIGRQIAIDLATAGAKIALNYRSNEDAAKEVATAIEAAGSQCLRLAGSVDDEPFVKGIGKQIQGELGGLDILVNNAGVTRDGPFATMARSKFDEVIAINLTGQFLVARMASRLMMRKKWGRIINLTSLSGERGNAGQANYAASKGGVIALTKTLAVELSRFNILVNAVSPGLIETDMVENIPEQARAHMLTAIPLGRMGRPDEVSGLVVFLASEASSYITGQVFRINGGLAV